MSLFKKWKPKTEAFHFDRDKYIPVIKASICNGEQAIGWKEIETGRFEEVMFLRSNNDLQKFLAQYGISLEEVKKEW